MLLEVFLCAVLCQVLEQTKPIHRLPVLDCCRDAMSDRQLLSSG